MYSNTRPKREKETTPSWRHKLVGDTTEKTLPPSVTGELVMAPGSSEQQDQCVPEGGTRAHSTDLAKAHWTFSSSFLGLEGVLGKQSSGF